MIKRKLKKKVGLVLGKFQPPHKGHFYLIDQAFKENDIVVICVGSSQISDPLPAQERYQKISEKLKIEGYNSEKDRIVLLNDINSMEKWPLYLKRGCKITNKTENTFYTGEVLSKDYKNAMEKIGFKIKVVKKKMFCFKSPDSVLHLVSSASEIRTLSGK